MASATSGRVMQGEEFTVQGMTGVDLSLQIAGPGSRAYAFIIDWHVRLLGALAWVIVSMLSVNGGLRFGPKPSPWTIALIFGPAAIIYLLYHLIVELLMRGQTPGKRMAGVRIVNRDGGPPGAGAILVRNAFRLIDALPTLYVVGLVTTFLTDQRVRIGDMAAGTLLVMNDTDTAKSLERLTQRGDSDGIDPATLDVVDRILERWKQLDSGRRGDLARTLLRRIDSTPPEALATLSDTELRARLMTLSGHRESR